MRCFAGSGAGYRDRSVGRGLNWQHRATPEAGWESFWVYKKLIGKIYPKEQFFMVIMARIGYNSANMHIYTHEIMGFVGIFLIYWRNIPNTRMKAPYEQSKKYPEHLIHKTNSDYCVHSKSGAFIDMTLRKYKIPFRYEYALEIDGFTHI